MPSVVLVFCLALSLASLTAGKLNRLDRIEIRIDRMEDRQDRANISRREDKTDLFLRLDDIEALMNSSVTEHTIKAAIETSDRQVKHDVESLNKSINGIKDDIEDSDRNVNNTIKSLEDSIKDNTAEILDKMKTKLDTTLNDVKHKVKHDVKSLNESINGITYAIEDSDRNVNNTIKSLEDSIKDNTAEILDAMKTKLNTTLNDVKHEVKHDVKSLNESINGINDAIEDSDRNVNNTIHSLEDSIKDNTAEILDEMKTKLDTTLNDVKHEVKHGVKRLNESINGINDAIEDAERNVNNTIKSLEDSIKDNIDEILDEMKTKLNTTLSDVKHEVKAVIDTSDREVKHDVKSLNKSINGIKDAIEDSDRNVNNTIKSLNDSIKGNTNENLDKMKTKFDTTFNDVKHEMKAAIETSDIQVKHDVNSLNKSINGIKVAIEDTDRNVNNTIKSLKDLMLDEMKNVKNETVAACEQNSKFVLDKLSNLERTVNNVMHDVTRKLDSVLDNQSSMDKLLEKIFSKPEIFSSCLEIYRAGGRKSGLYNIYPVPGQPSITVYCDMDTDGGGWTVFQRRQDGSVDFFRNWEDYAQGFGKPDGEFWLGNEHISALTNTTCCSELRVDLEDFDGNRAYAKYRKFQVAPREDNFRLEVSGYSGNSSDSLTHHSGMEFSTKDRDNDKDTRHCAEFYSGAWWFNDCYLSHLNGLYITEEKKQSWEIGVEWDHWKPDYSLKLTEMKIRSI